MVIAVTGATGFIGSHLTEELARRGHRVIGIGRQRCPPTDATARPGVEHVAVDYHCATALARALDGVDTVIHAAAATRAPTSEALAASNVAVTEQVLAAIRSIGSVPRFVLVSSLAAAGPAPAFDAPKSEDDAAAPIEAYGRSKLAAERLLERETVLPWTVVRPAAVYGPRDRDFLHMFRLAARGIAVHAANRSSWISILHVRDVVAGLIVAATRPEAVGRRYFLANDTPVQWGELFARAAAAAGRHLSLDVELPRFLVAFGGRLGDVHARITGDASLLTGEKVALGRAPFWICSADRARRELAFAPGVSLDDGIADTYRWYVERGWLRGAT
jgi:nucleoside-diphosphate-sugar epimerase